MTKTKEEPIKPTKEKLIEKGLHLDWLYRAQRASTTETLIYLWRQRQKWINEDQKLILTILQDYEKSGGGLIAEHNPVNLKRKTRKSFFEKSQESPEIFEFTCELLDLVKEERPIWDKTNCADFGYHQPMRQSWCSVSLKLGGWGTMQHVHMIKQLYRRRRDQYNIDHLRQGRLFPYSEKLSFLKNQLEMSNRDSVQFEVKLEDHINVMNPKIDYDNEINAAPEYIQHLLNTISATIDEANTVFSPQEFAEYLSNCCNEVVANREYLASSGYLDEEWIERIVEEKD